MMDISNLVFGLIALVVILLFILIAFTVFNLRKLKEIKRLNEKMVFYQVLFIKGSQLSFDETLLSSLERKKLNKLGLLENKDN